MRRFFRCFLVWAALALGPAIAVASASEPITFATEGDYPPWNSTGANGELAGFDIDLVDALCAALGDECRLVAAGFPGMMDQLAERKFDAIISGIAITATREEKIGFTRPYMSLSVSFATAAGSALATTSTLSKADLLARLTSATLGAQSGTVNARLIERLLPEANLITFDNQELLNAAVAAGVVDAGLAATLTWSNPAPANAADVTAIGPPLTSAAYPLLGHGLGIGIAKTNHPLKARLDTAICGLSGDGTIARLSQKWFGADLSVPCE
jgi:octopine/nopaline transport system substrate-binding protein